MTCCWHTCREPAAYVFYGVDGRARGVCRRHVLDAERAAESLGVAFAPMGVVNFGTLNETKGRPDDRDP